MLWSLQKCLYLLIRGRGQGKESEIYFLISLSECGKIWHTRLLKRQFSRFEPKKGRPMRSTTFITIGETPTGIDFSPDCQKKISQLS